MPGSVSTRKYFLGFMAVAMILIIFSCKKDPNQIGLNIQPEVDKIGVIYSDTMSIVARSKLVDSITTSLTGLALIGSYFDPVFGPSTTAFSTQLRLSTAAHSFGDNPILDSLILIMKYDGIYGSEEEVQTIKVYELDNRIVFDSIYYSTSVVPHKSTVLAERDFTPNINDSVVVNGDTLAPHLRINLAGLTDELALKLLAADSSIMSSNETFSDYFNGLRIEAQEISSGGGIVYYDLIHSMSRMELYYHNDEDDSLQFDYTISSYSARFGNFYHDYDQADMEFRNQVIFGDTTMGEQKCYLQPMAGVVTYLDFPEITSWYDDGAIAINEALLYLDGYEDEPEYDPPIYLALVQRISDTTVSPLIDQQEGQVFFGGEYDTDENRYYFRITSHIQNIMSGDSENYTLELGVDGGSYNANRFVLNGTNPFDPIPVERRMRLELVYTIIN